VVELVQPAALVPTTVYVVVMVGLAVTLAPLEALSVALGLHVYEAAPLAVNVPVLPLQMLIGGTLTVGGALMVTATVVCVDVHAPVGLTTCSCTLNVPAPLHCTT
jgi:hypothetical protein